MSVQIPKTMRALVENQDGKKSSVQEKSVPELGDNDVLVKVAYVSQNPTDWKHTEIPGITVPGATIGCDYSGTIVALGKNITNSALKEGDKVASMVHGGKFQDKGAFAEYTRVESDLLWKISDNSSVGLREAPIYGIAFTTAAQILYKRQGIAYPPAQKISGDEWYLVYGGSSSVGLYAVQLAKLAGYKVVATASSKNFDLVKSYGAEEVVDYKDAIKASSEIKRITNNTLKLALDTISEPESLKLTLDSFTDKEGQKKLNTLLPAGEDAQKLAKEKGVEIESSLAYTLMGKGFTFFSGMDIPSIPEDREFYVQLNKDTPDFIGKHGIKPNPVTDRGNLDDILAGFDDMKNGKVSATKLVYKIAA